MSDADAPPPERDAFTPPPSRQRPADVRPRRPALLAPLLIGGGAGAIVGGVIAAIVLLIGGGTDVQSGGAGGKSDTDWEIERLCSEMHYMATSVVTRPYFHLLPAQVRWSWEVGAEVEREQFVSNCAHNLPDYAAAVAEHARMSEEVERMDRIWRDNQNEDAAADGAY